MSEKNTKQTNTLRYSIGMFGTSIPINMFKTYASFYYVDSLGLLTTPQWATIIFFYTFVDAIDNPLYGYLSDRTRSKWGRRRPWLVLGTPLLVLCFIMFFNPLGWLAKGSAFSYVLLMYMLTGTLDSLINANYSALFPELFRSEKDRAKANSLRQIFQLLAMIISIALTPVITEAIGFSATAIVYGILAAIVIWYMAFGCREDLAVMDQPRPKLLKSCLDIVKNPKFWIYGITNASYYGGLALVQAGVPYYVKYHLGEGSVGSTILLGVVILTAIIFIPVWAQVMKRLSLLTTWRLSLIVACLSLIPLYFTTTLIPSACVAALFGIGMGGVTVTMDIVSARILDEDIEKHEIQREGMYSSLLGVLNKTSNLFVSLAYVLVFQIYGFESGDNPGLLPGQSSLFLTILFPIILFMICIFVSHFLKFSNKPKKEQ